MYLHRAVRSVIGRWFPVKIASKKTQLQHTIAAHRCLALLWLCGCGVSRNENGLFYLSKIGGTSLNQKTQICLF